MQKKYQTGLLFFIIIFGNFKKPNDQSPERSLKNYFYFLTSAWITLTVSTLSTPKPSC
jgi:hypothetical protein